MEGWKISTLGEACDLYQPKTISKKELVEDGAYVVFGANGPIGRYHSFNHADPQIVVTCRGATCGSVNTTPPNSWITGNAMVIAPKENCLDPRFLQYLMLHTDFSSVISGAAQPQITRTSLSPLEINYPTSLPEQERIVAMLDEAFAAIDTATTNTQKNLANARGIFQSIVQFSLSHKGDGWLETTLGELGKVSMCKRILKKQTSPTGDIPFYKIGTFGKMPNAFISNDIYQNFREKYSFPRKGDILISASGTIGRRVVYDGEPAYFQDSNIVWIANAEDLVINPYLYYYYEICEWNPSKGATISRLYNDDFRRIKISFPADRLRQAELVKQLEEGEEYCQKLESTCQSKQANLAKLKQSLLQKAFTGELTADPKVVDRTLSEASV